jgi:protein-S-isoprenylcysteine O-methyltransferase Ste14
MPLQDWIGTFEGAFQKGRNMAFHDEHSPSIPAKVVLSAGVLAGTLLAAILMSGYADGLSDLLKYERVQGNSWRQIIILSCSLVYFIRLIIGLFVFLNRKISWFEGGLVSFLFFLMFYLFGVSAGSHPEPIGLLDIVGIFLFLAGSTINTLAEYQRFVWKRKTENQGRLYTRGLFKYSMHINYFGDSVCYVGLALITLELGYLMVPIVIILNFIVLQIPLLDDHLSRKYENEFREYAKRTKKFVPFIY